MPSERFYLISAVAAVLFMFGCILAYGGGSDFEVYPEVPVEAAPAGEIWEPGGLGNPYVVHGRDGRRIGEIVPDLPKGYGPKGEIYEPGGFLNPGRVEWD